MGSTDFQDKIAILAERTTSIKLELTRRELTLLKEVTVEQAKSLYLESGWLWDANVELMYQKLAYQVLRCQMYHGPYLSLRFFPFGLWDASRSYIGGASNDYYSQVLERHGLSGCRFCIVAADSSYNDILYVENGDFLMFDFDSVGYFLLGDFDNFIKLVSGEEVPIERVDD